MIYNDIFNIPSESDFYICSLCGTPATQFTLKCQKCDHRFPNPQTKRSKLAIQKSFYCLVTIASLLLITSIVTYFSFTYDFDRNYFWHNFSDTRRYTKTAYYMDKSGTLILFLKYVPAIYPLLLSIVYFTLAKYCRRGSYKALIIAMIIYSLNAAVNALISFSFAVLLIQLFVLYFLMLGTQASLEIKNIDDVLATN